MPDFYRRMVAASYFNLLVYTRHAQREIAQDKYGVLSLEQIPLAIQCREWELVELEITETDVLGPVISKYVLRRQVTNRRSLVIVLRPESHTVANVITCWTNLNTDTHKTLDRSKYSTI